MHITIPITARSTDTLHSAETLDGFYESSYRSPADARNKLQHLVRTKLSDLALAERNAGRQLLGCKDGTVILVEFRYGTWGYSLGGSDRTRASSCSAAWTRLQDAVQAATEHAEQSFGGITWRHSV